LALDGLLSRLGVTDYTKPWEAHERIQQFRVNESIDIGKNQRLQKESYT
jgi:hypothetical protein